LRTKLGGVALPKLNGSYRAKCTATLDRNGTASDKIEFGIGARLSTLPKAAIQWRYGSDP
jgi:hypothetical protein